MSHFRSDGSYMLEGSYQALELRIWGLSIAAMQACLMLF